jgi:hypothetical protein
MGGCQPLKPAGRRGGIAVRQRADVARPLRAFQQTFAFVRVSPRCSTAAL